MLDQPDRSSSQEASSLVNSAGRTTRAVSRNLEHSDTDGEVALGHQHRLDRNIV